MSEPRDRNALTIAELMTTTLCDPPTTPSVPAVAGEPAPDDLLSHLRFIAATLSACVESDGDLGDWVRPGWFVDDVAPTIHRVIERLERSSSSVSAPSGGASEPDLWTETWGGFGIVRTISGDWLLVDVNDDFAPVARFVSEDEARRFWQFVQRRISL